MQKHEETNAAAMDILDRERSSREQKTANLRQLRLAKEADLAASTPIILGSRKSKRR